MASRRGKFTPGQIRAAIEVLMESKLVRNWVTSQANYLGVSLDTPEGKNFLEKEKRAVAEKLIR